MTTRVTAPCNLLRYDTVPRSAKRSYHDGQPACSTAAVDAWKPIRQRSPLRLRSRTVYPMQYPHYDPACPNPKGTLIRKIVTVGALLILVFFPFQEAYAQDEENCDDALVRADNFYFEAQFSEATLLLEYCLKQAAFSGETLQRAYILLGKAKFASGLEEQAREAIRTLLELIPNYQPNPETDRPSFIAMVEEERRRQAAAQAELEQPRRKRGLSKWLLIGGGAVAAGTVGVLVASGGNGKTNPIPLPPGRPSGN